MDSNPTVRWWSWLWTSLLFVMAAVVFQWVASLSDGWFARLGVFAFTGVLRDLGMIFLAAFSSAAIFMRWFGHAQAMRRRLGLAYMIAFTIWTALSFLLIANMLRFAPVTLGLGGFALGEAVLGSALVFAAVVVCGRLFERNHARRTALGGVS